ncbi:polysaccharide pyruvyl transferase CsaB [Candidatus Acetothermia bacterium]|jgi:polysaccharide pyruvyl transferase CsaB|nr:polysaccharide pyruvyl transferase CsaB [Candidatus Acetothermia bacterium]MCI2432282.1 polysaccharide pyruvyl transferase CsaB [Candidatus Acetothermia bacterium]MCI2437407.1 polysaccharide pyruvyl transferase CsaB [Candidatus Acetothermia bacterium]
MAKKIVVAGYYGFGNWGDEATLSVLLGYLKKACPQARITVLSHDPSATERLHTVNAINRWNPWRVHRALQKASAFVLGPGSLLQDTTSTRSLLYYLGLLHWAERLSKPVYFLGQGIGPLRSAHSEHWAARTLRKAQLILLREEASYEWARRQKIAQGRLLLGEDLALLYDSHPHPLPSPYKGEGIRLALSLRPGLSPQNLEELCCALETLQKKLPIDGWALLPFHPAQDEPVLSAVARALGSSASLAHAVSPAHLLQVIEESDLLIGMRLHSLIFALLTGTPFYALSYDPKIESFIKRMEETAQYPLCWRRVGEDLASASLVAQIERIFAERERLKTKLASARAILQARAEAALREAIAQLAEDLENL